MAAGRFVADSTRAKIRKSGNEICTCVIGRRCQDPDRHRMRGTMGRDYACMKCGREHRLRVQGHGTVAARARACSLHVVRHSIAVCSTLLGQNSIVWPAMSAEDGVVADFVENLVRSVLEPVGTQNDCGCTYNEPYHTCPVCRVTVCFEHRHILCMSFYSGATDTTVQSPCTWSSAVGVGEDLT